MKCKLESCDRKAEKKKLCLAHYARYQRNGEGFDVSPIKEMTLLGRFKHKMNNQNSNGCIEYSGEKNANGYGKFYIIPKKYTMAHRMAYELFVGEIPDGMFVCHHCDNPPCVNPRHLFVGTNADNMKDMFDKGRAPYKIGVAPNIDNKGSKHVFAKLNEDIVRDIKIKLLQGSKGTELARKYNVCDQTIYEIKNGKNWKHVTI